MIQKIPLLLLFAFLLFSCKSSKKIAPGQIQVKPDIETLSPGQVLAQFKILNEEATETDSNPIFGIEILNIKKYGFATPAIAKGDVIRILLRSISLKKQLTVGSIHVGLFSHDENISSSKQIPTLGLISIR